MWYDPDDGDDGPEVNTDSILNAFQSAIGTGVGTSQGNYAYTTMENPSDDSSDKFRGSVFVQ